MKDRILKACKRAKEIESRFFTEKEMRGLTNDEKEFIRDNDYNVCVSACIDAFGDKKQKLYMFIARQRNGRKALYAITKWQSVYPGGKDFAPCVYNYQCWMTFSKKENGFSKFYYEFRFSTMDNSELIINA